MNIYKIITMLACHLWKRSLSSSGRWVLQSVVGPRYTGCKASLWIPSSTTSGLACRHDWFQNVKIICSKIVFIQLFIL